MMSLIFWLLKVAVIVTIGNFLRKLNLKWFNTLGIIGRYAFVWGCIALIVTHTLLEVIWVASIVLYACIKAHGWPAVKANLSKPFIKVKTLAETIRR